MDNTPDSSNPKKSTLKAVDRPILFSSLEELKQLTLNEFDKARQKIQLYTHNLDPRVLNNRQIEGALIRFIKQSRYIKIQLLIKKERLLQGIDHRLVKLTHQFPGYISIRVIPEDFHGSHFSFYLIDDRQLIYRNINDRFECEFHSAPDNMLKQKSRFFEEVWQQSSTASSLRAMIL